MRFRHCPVTFGIHIYYLKITLWSAVSCALDQMPRFLQLMVCQAHNYTRSDLTYSLPIALSAKTIWRSELLPFWRIAV